MYDALNDDHILAISLLYGKAIGMIAALLPTEKTNEQRIGKKYKGNDLKKVLGASHAQPEF